MSNILITSCDTTPEGGKAQAMKMLELFELSDKRHSLTNDPVLADFILICDTTWEKYGDKIRNNKFIKKFPSKCFILSNLANPFYYNRGIITNTEKSASWFDRFRSCSYTAYYDPYHNPFVANHESKKGIEKRGYLFSFVGRNCHPVRDTIFNYPFKRKDILIRDTTQVFDLWNGSAPDIKLQEEYYNVMLHSKFILCPRGVGANSIRLFEAMKLGLAPVLLSDDFALPKGPVWEEFCIIVKEKDVASLESIVSGYEDRYEDMGKKAKQNYDQYFDEKNYFNYVVNNISEIANSQLIPEIIFHKLTDLAIIIQRGASFFPNKWYYLKKSFKYVLKK